MTLDDDTINDVLSNLEIRLRRKLEEHLKSKKETPPEFSFFELDDFETMALFLLLENNNWNPPSSQALVNHDIRKNALSSALAESVLEKNSTLREDDEEGNALGGLFPMNGPTGMGKTTALHRRSSPIQPVDGLEALLPHDKGSLIENVMRLLDFFSFPSIFESAFESGRDSVYLTIRTNIIDSIENACRESGGKIVAHRVNNINSTITKFLLDGVELTRPNGKNRFDGKDRPDEERLMELRAKKIETLKSLNRFCEDNGYLSTKDGSGATIEKEDVKKREKDIEAIYDILYRSLMLGSFSDEDKNSLVRHSADLEKFYARILKRNRDQFDGRAKELLDLHISMRSRQTTGGTSRGKSAGVKDENGGNMRGGTNLLDKLVLLFFELFPGYACAIGNANSRQRMDEAKAGKRPIAPGDISIHVLLATIQKFSFGIFDGAEYLMISNERMSNKAFFLDEFDFLHDPILEKLSSTPSLAEPLKFMEIMVDGKNAINGTFTMLSGIADEIEIVEADELLEIRDKGWNRNSANKLELIDNNERLVELITRNRAQMKGNEELKVRFGVLKRIHNTQKRLVNTLSNWGVSEFNSTIKLYPEYADDDEGLMGDIRLSKKLLSDRQIGEFFQIGRKFSNMDIRILMRDNFHNALIIYKRGWRPGGKRGVTLHRIMRACQEAVEDLASLYNIYCDPQSSSIVDKMLESYFDDYNNGKPNEYRIHIKNISRYCGNKPGSKRRAGANPTKTSHAVAGDHMPFVPLSEFYINGMICAYLRESQTKNGEFNVKLMRIPQSPEALIVGMATNNLVFPISATMNIPRAVGTFDLKWIFMHMRALNQSLAYGISERRELLANWLSSIMEKGGHAGVPPKSMSDYGEKLICKISLRSELENGMESRFIQKASHEKALAKKIVSPSDEDGSKAVINPQKLQNMIMEIDDTEIRIDGKTIVFNEDAEAFQYISHEFFETGQNATKLKFRRLVCLKLLAAIRHTCWKNDGYASIAYVNAFRWFKKIFAEAGGDDDVSAGRHREIREAHGLLLEKDVEFSRDKLRKLIEDKNHKPSEKRMKEWHSFLKAMDRWMVWNNQVKSDLQSQGPSASIAELLDSKQMFLVLASCTNPEKGVPIHNNVVLLFLDADAFRRPNFNELYDSVFGLGADRVLIVTQNNSATNGINLDYLSPKRLVSIADGEPIDHVFQKADHQKRRSDESRCDIDTIYLLENDHFVMSLEEDADEAKREQQISILLYEMIKLNAWNEKEFRKNYVESKIGSLLDGKKRQEILIDEIKGLNGTYKKSLDYAMKEVAGMIQRYGRIDRTRTEPPSTVVTVQTDDLFNVDLKKRLSSKKTARQFESDEANLSPLTRNAIMSYFKSMRGKDQQPGNGGGLTDEEYERFFKNALGTIRKMRGEDSDKAYACIRFIQRLRMSLITCDLSPFIRGQDKDPANLLDCRFEMEHLIVGREDSKTSNCGMLHEIVEKYSSASLAIWKKFKDIDLRLPESEHPPEVANLTYISEKFANTQVMGVLCEQMFEALVEEMMNADSRFKEKTVRLSSQPGSHKCYEAYDFSFTNSNVRVDLKAFSESTFAKLDLSHRDWKKNLENGQKSNSDGEVYQFFSDAVEHLRLIREHENKNGVLVLALWKKPQDNVNDHLFFFDAKFDRIEDHGPKRDLENADIVVIPGCVELCEETLYYTEAFKEFIKTMNSKNEAFESDANPFNEKGE